ncbi:MAG TPA: LamG domain-containing protein [Streptosporangiaceae bacterium]|nr:LamG domain-containing protein [Streptosporangiaceae bacterium]
MLSQDQWTWPSTNCNGIPLADPVTISFQGTVVVFARQAAVPVAQLYTNVRLPGSDSSSPGEWAGWNPLPMTEPSQSDVPGPAQPTADELPLLRLGSMDLLTVDKVATTPSPADAPFRVVTDGRTISCFRQSTAGSLYVDRFVLVEVPSAGSDDRSTTPAWELRRVWEVRYQRSELRDVPNGQMDTLDARNLLSEPFLEPTAELPVISGIANGAFDVTLAPTSEAERMRWYIVAVTNGKLTCLSYPQDANGRIDLNPATAATVTIDPAALRSDAARVPLTAYAGVAVATYQEQESVLTTDGKAAGLRRTTRLMVTAPVKNDAAGLRAALAVYDFTVQPDGTIPAYPSTAACVPVDGTLGDGHFTPSPGNPNYTVPDKAVLPAGTGTIASVLLGQPQPAAAPALSDSSDGLVHLYFAGPPGEGDSPGPFLVAQHDPTVTRVRAAVPWTANSTSGTFGLVGLRSGTSLNGLAVAVADCDSQADLCTLTIGYGSASGLPAETWHGVPRNALTMISILNGRSSGDPSDPAVLSGAVTFYDLQGKRSMARLPLTGGDAGAHLTLVSHRPDVPVATASVLPPAGGTTTLTLGFKVPGYTVTQTWAGVPTDTTYLVPVLSGDAADYGYTATDLPVYGVATDAGSILLFASVTDAITITVQTASNGDPSQCDIVVTEGTRHPVTDPIKLVNIDRDQASLVAALRGSTALRSCFGYISPDPAPGSAANQAITARLDLRALSLLFDPVIPAPGGFLTQVSTTASVLQGRSFASPPPSAVPSGRGMLALAALAPTVPLLGAQPVVGNGTCPITEQGRNGQWLVAPAPSALSFSEHNAVQVQHPGTYTAPTRTWTMEAWACPTDGTPSRIVTYNGGTAPPLAGVTPSYFMGTVAQPAIQYASFTPAAPYAGSYINVPAYPAFSPTSGQAFTWEAWIRPSAEPCPAKGTNLLGCVLQGQDTVFPDCAQWQLGVRHDLRLTFGLRTGSIGVPAQTYIDSDAPLAAATWTHVAVTGSQGKSSWTIVLYVGAKAVKTLQNVVPYPESEAPFLCIGASDIQNVSMFGGLAEVRFWSFAATPAELKRTMNASLTGHEPGLLGYWPLNDDPAGGSFANKADSGAALDGSLRKAPAQPVTQSTDGSFVSVVAGVGSAPAIMARAFLPANRWNHFAAVYEAAGALSLNPGGIGSARADYGLCENSSGLTFNQAASVEAWVQMAQATHISQSVLAQWGVGQNDQAYQLGVDAGGHPYCTVNLTNSSNSDLTTVTATATSSVIDSAPHHVMATFAVTQPSSGTSVVTITMYVDGAAQTPAVKSISATTVQLTTSSAPVTVGISALSTTATGPVAYSAQAPFVGVLTGVRFWSAALTADQVKAAMTGKQSADGDSGVVSAWWFTEQAGMLAADSASGNDLTLSDTDMWAAFASIATLDLYGNGVPMGLVVKAPADTIGGYPGDAQLTIGAYTDSNVIKDGFSGQIAELRLWNASRSRDQLIDTMYRGLNGDEADLNAYWTFDGTTADETGRGANGTLIGSPPPSYVPSLAPVSNEGPQVRNVYNGPVTDYQEPLTGRAAVIEYAETDTRWDGSPFAVLRRAYFYGNPSLTLATGYGLGEIGMIYIGQMQTNPTLIGYIEGAPPCPSENLSRPLYQSVFGYNSYLDATSVMLEQDETKELSFTSSDYRTSLQMSLDVKFGYRYENEFGITFPWLGYVKLFGYKGKIGVHHTSALTKAKQQDEKYSSAWTHTLTDALGLRGMWEQEGPPADYVNPAVGRRYQPLNLGYALVESLTADVFALQLRSTGAMVGRIVVPNLAIPPDRNILTFKIDPGYVKNGTLDGKIGLANDPGYPKADLQRGSYFKPADAYALAAAIEREEADLRAYYDQFDAISAGQAGPGAPSLSGPGAEQFYDFSAGKATRGIVNRYVWTALGGLHTETDRFSSTHERTFTGLYDYTHGTGGGGEIETGSAAGIYGGLDLLFGGQIKISVGKAESQTETLSLNVTVNCDPMLQGYDNATQTYTNRYCPGKVDAYRFMTFYLPPSAQNGDDFLKKVVDRQWLDLSSDPNAIALRQAKIQDNGAWRVLHRVTYVSRVPPPFDTNPNQTVAPEPPQAVNVADNALLITLVQAALGERPPTLANVGAAVATVLAPADGTSPSVLGQLVPWWTAFLQSTRAGHADAVALMDKLLTRTVNYMQAGYAAGLLPIPVAAAPVTRKIHARR